MANQGRRNSYNVQSLARGFQVIRAFDADHRHLTLSDVARQTGLTRATARRFLLTLEDLGYVRSDGRLFSLTPRVLELGYAYLSSTSLAEVAQPHLERLVAEVQESSSVAVLDKKDVVYVARVATRRIMRIAINIGTRFPAYATSLGRVLLSGLSPQELDEYFSDIEIEASTAKSISEEAALRAEIKQTREQGWAVVDQELEEGLRSVAVPIRQGTGRIVAAVNLSTHSTRTSLDTIGTTLLPALQATAREIEADLPPV